jgi:hypothetical protein
MKRMLCCVLLLMTSALGAGSPPATDAQHAFDFSIGSWKTHIRQLEHPLSGSATWVEGAGTVSVRKIWDGGANLEELEADFPGRHVEGLTLRLYNPASQQWNLWWANASEGVLSTPNIGQFKDGRGEFFDQERYEGRMVVVRQVYSDATASSYHFEQAYSADHGRTWENNFVADVTRLSAEPKPSSVAARDRNRDFDFNFGRWNTHVSRLRSVLTGDTRWVDYEGSSDIEPVWDGRASLFELNVSGAAGEIHGLGLRLYDRSADEWNLNWTNRSIGILGVPTVGRFQNHRGEFMDLELVDGKQTFVRNSFTAITPSSSRFEQAFSADGGRTWETNWIMTFAKNLKGAH